ncbi:MAG: hypothetical protein Q4C72_05935 [Eubacteriales bacterium]|nr:hypothetical protein [Eubacteriales bacterium]
MQHVLHRLLGLLLARAVLQVERNIAEIQVGNIDFKRGAGGIVAQQRFAGRLSGLVAVFFKDDADALCQLLNLLVRGLGAEVEQLVDRQAERAGERRQQCDIGIACAGFT